MDYLSLESIFFSIDQDSQQAWRIYLEHGVIARLSQHSLAINACFIKSTND